MQRKNKYYNILVPSSSDKNKFRTDNDTFYTETFPVKVICIIEYKERNVIQQKTCFQSSDIQLNELSI